MIKDERLEQASEQDGTYPRPQLMRSDWADLSGSWDFQFDPADRGIHEKWYEDATNWGTIVVPFPPEAPLSGIGDNSPHSVMWYRRLLDTRDFDQAGWTPGKRLLVHFGAVDYAATVWVDGHRVGEHEGGQTPFCCDLTEYLSDASGHELVVRAEDYPHEKNLPRGKQDWMDDPHAIWYHRTSGIWQPVWLEAVPPVAISDLHWSSDLDAGSVSAVITMDHQLESEIPISITLSKSGFDIAEISVITRERETKLTIEIPEIRRQDNAEYLWSPESPTLIDAVVRADKDVVSSYFGIRNIKVAFRHFMLNDRPYYLRSVLSQGYWPDSHLSAPSAAALKREVEWIRELGFNAARVHQKYEDPRFFYWADRLGLAVWAEAPAAFDFSVLAVGRTLGEWADIVRRDYSHPSIVTWVPLNESWGVPCIDGDQRMQHYARALVELTKALDPTRPVVSNDGWEQVDTDIVAIHDYSSSPETLKSRYFDRCSIDNMIDSVGPSGRRLVLSGDVSQLPIMLTEFGGISYDTGSLSESWGYSEATSSSDLERRLREMLAVIRECSALSGFCYTQLTDTLQETNGILTADRTPKVPVEALRDVFGPSEVE